VDFIFKVFLRRLIVCNSPTHVDDFMQMISSDQWLMKSPHGRPTGRLLKRTLDTRSPTLHVAALVA